MGIFGRKKNGKPYPKIRDNTPSQMDANTRKLIIASQQETDIIAQFNEGKISQDDAQKMLTPIEKTRLDAASKIKEIRIEKTDKKE